MMTNEEARAAVEAELFALKLTQRMTLPDKIAFCESAHRRLVFESDTDRLREILVWAETWQSLWLPDKLTSVGMSISASGDSRYRRATFSAAVVRMGADRVTHRGRPVAVVGVVFATRRAAVPENENELDEVGADLLK
jgi:hypothetical protein